MVSPTRRPTTCSTSSSASVERVALVNSATARHQPLRAVSARPSLLSAVGKGGATRDHANAEDACGGVAPIQCRSSPHRPACLRRRRAWTRGAAFPVHRQLHYAKAHYTTPQPGSMLKGVEPMSLVGALRRAARCLPRLLASWAARGQRSWVCIGAPRAIRYMAYVCSLDCLWLQAQRVADRLEQVLCAATGLHTVGHR